MSVSNVEHFPCGSIATDLILTWMWKHFALYIEFANNIWQRQAGKLSKCWVFSCLIVFQSSVIRPGLCFCVFLIQGKPNYLRKLIVGLTGVLTCDLRHGKIKTEREYRNDSSQRFKVKQRSIFLCKKRISKAAFHCSRKDKTFFTYGLGADISLPPYPNGIKLKSNLPTEIWVAPPRYYVLTPRPELTSTG